MRYPTAERFRAALEDRLRQQARTTSLPLVRLRKDVVFERLLARLLIAAPDRWILKGGLALDYRLGDRQISLVTRTGCSRSGERHGPAVPVTMPGRHAPGPRSVNSR